MSSLSLCSVSCSIDVSTVSDRNLGPVNTCYKCTQLASCHAIALSRFRGLESSRGKVRCPTGSGAALWLTSATERKLVAVDTPGSHNL